MAFREAAWPHGNLQLLRCNLTGSEDVFRCSDSPLCFPQHCLSPKRYPPSSAALLPLLPRAPGGTRQQSWAPQAVVSLVETASLPLAWLGSAETLPFAFHASRNKGQQRRRLPLLQMAIQPPRCRDLPEDRHLVPKAKAEASSMQLCSLQRPQSPHL